MSTADPRELRRILYTSRAVKGDLIDILAVSRANNGIDGVTGLLLARGSEYVQLLEGPPESVGRAFQRIERDERHTGINVLSDSTANSRVFADWAMAGLPGEPGDVMAIRLQAALRDAPDDVRSAFAVQ